MRLPYGDQIQLRDYFNYCKQLFRAKYFLEVLEEMSPELKGLIAKHVHGYYSRVSNRIGFFFTIFCLP
jgi:hypothetical protein